MSAWAIEYERGAFEQFLFTLPDYEQAMLVAAIEHVLQRYSIDICSGKWGKPLGDGLYKLRVRNSLWTILANAGLEAPQTTSSDRRVLLPVFCAFHGNRVVLLYHGYNKKADPSGKRQHREIARARKLHGR